MSKIGLSVVIPMHNAASWIIPTVKCIFTALKKSNFQAEIIIVDDGSTDASVREAQSIPVPKGIDFKIIEQSNKGRYLARKAGVTKARHDNILFIDSRVFIDQKALQFLSKQLQSNPDQIWNGHVNIDKEGNIFARFWDAIVCIAWRRYFKWPHTTQYELKDFDHYPKGTGFFFVPKKRLLEAMAHFEEQTSDLKFSSDDTLLIRHMIARTPIHLSPEFSCLYHGRSTFKKFLRHAYDRGQFFIDGFLRPGTRFFLPLIGVLVLSILLIVALIVAPVFTLKFLLVCAALFIMILFLGAIYFRVATPDAASLALLGVPFAIVYLAGLWRGVARKITSNPIESYGALVLQRIDFLKGTVAEYLIVLVGYIAVAGVLTKGVIFNLGDQIYATIGDATAGFMWLNYAEPGLSPILSSTDDVNYPVGEAVGGPTFIAYYAIWIPIRVLSYIFGPIAGLNLVMFVGFVSAAMAGYWLLKRITRNIGVAAFAGYAIAFTPYALYKSSGHIAYIFSAVFVFILAAFIGLWRRPTVWRGILLAGAIALAFYTDGYYVLLASVMVVACVLGGILFGVLSRYRMRDYVLRMKSLLVALGVLLILLSPLGLTQVLQGDQVKERLSGSRSSISSEMTIYRSNIVDFLLPSEHHPQAKYNEGFLEVFNYKIQRSNGSESMNYVGYGVLALVTFGLAILGVWAFFRKSLSLPNSDAGLQHFALIGCIAVIAVPLMLSFMFSPGVTVFGYHVPLPGQLFIEYDLNLWRVMSRFFVPLHVILVVFASISLYVLYRYLVPIKRTTRRFRKAIAYCVVLFFIIFTAYEYYVDFPDRPYSFSKDMPYVYSWLRGRQDIDVIAELPLVDPLDEKTAGYVSSQIVHNKKIINFKDPSAARLNAALGDQSNSETIDFVEARGADVVLIRADTCSLYTWGNLIYKEKNPDKRGPLVCVYKLNDRNIDDAFVVYGAGFTPSPNAPDQNVAVFSAGGNGSLHVTGPDLKSSIRGEVDVNVTLGSHVNQNVDWSIYQSGKLLKSGVLSAGEDDTISFKVNGGEGDVQIKVKTKSLPIELGQLTLENVIASRVAQNK